MGNSNQFNKIGAGSYGKIFHQSGDPNAPALKVPIYAPDENTKWFIDWEFEIQKRIHGALAESGIDIVVPFARRLIAAEDDAWWTNHLPLFPPWEEHLLPRDTLAMDRIPALSSEIRTGLTNQFCPATTAEAREKILGEKGAADGIARVYLGGRRRPRTERRPQSVFSLRNMNLWLDQLEELQADVAAYAETMAKTMAVMHWKVGSDARDVEFYLGDPPLRERWLRLAPRPSLFNREVQLYLLDFNQVKTVSMDEEGVKSMVSAHAVNDPYYPKPLEEGLLEQDLWRRFRDAYLEKSSYLAQTETADKGETPAWAGLPQKFIDGVVEERQAKQAENARKKLAETAREAETTA